MRRPDHLGRQACWHFWTIKHCLNRLGFAGTALGIFLVVAIVIAFSLAGAGPFMAWPQGSVINRVVAIQLFTATMILLTYPVSAVIAAQDKLLREVADSERRFRMIAENSSDMVGLFRWLRSPFSQGIRSSIHYRRTLPRGMCGIPQTGGRESCTPAPALMACRRTPS